MVKRTNLLLNDPTLFFTLKKKLGEGERVSMDSGGGGKSMTAYIETVLLPGIKKMHKQV